MSRTPSRLVSLLASAAVVTLAAVGAPGMARADEPLPDGSGPTTAYLVEYAEVETSAVLDTLEDLGAAPDAQVTEVLDAVSVELTADEAAWLAEQPEVAGLTVDPVASIAAVEPAPAADPEPEPAADPAPAPAADPEASADRVQGSPTWGLDRVDQAGALGNGTFRYPTSAGQGVLTYVVDTGVAGSLPELGGRVTAGHSAVAAEPDAWMDLNGHGTHVAGTIASTTYGVAKRATVVPVKVLGATGEGPGSDVLAGLDWILLSHPPGQPGVVNMSLTMAEWPAMTDAVTALTDAGLTVVVAAGNESADACFVSPASASAAFATGASTAVDTVAWFSNTGRCVDGFAPGEAIESLSRTPGVVATMSGTSMASPHVAGIAALYLGTTPSATPAQVRATLLAGAVPTIVGAPAGTTSRLVTTLAIPTNGIPSQVHVTGMTTTSVTVAWTAPTPLAPRPLTGYVVKVVDVATRAVVTSTVPATRTAATITGLQRATAYTISVRADSAVEPGEASAPLSISTVSGPPRTPTAVTPGGVTSTRAAVTWTAPVPVSGAAVTTSVVSWRAAGATAWSTKAVPGSATSAALAGLSPGTEYEVTVTARAWSVAGTATSPVTFRTPRRGATPTERYVIGVYDLLFHRSPDAGGLASWSAALERGTPRSAVADAITSSPEYRSTLIRGAYAAYLGRSADAGGLASWLGAMNRGMTIQQMEGGFISSDEYWARAGGTGAGWVSALYRDVLDRPASAAEVGYWAGRLAMGTTRYAVAMGFLLSTEHLATVLDGHYVTLLGRHMDPSGQGTWVGAIQRGARIEQVIGGVVASDEFWQRHTA